MKKPLPFPQGVCVFCRKRRLIVADFGIYACIMVSYPGLVVPQANLNLTHPVCRTCHRALTKNGEPLVQLASRGLTKRLTRKQEAARVRKEERRQRRLLEEDRP